MILIKYLTHWILLNYISQYVLPVVFWVYLFVVQNLWWATSHPYVVAIIVLLLAGFKLV